MLGFLMSIVQVENSVKAKPGVWPQLQALLGGDFDSWLTSLSDLPEGAEYMYRRRNNDQLYVRKLQVGDVEYDVILNHNASPTNAGSQWVIERVIRSVEHGYNSLTPGEKELLRVITPWLRG
jgi:hypothetical protein